MGLLLVGIVLLALGLLLPVPYALYWLLIIIGVVLIIWGAIIAFTGYHGSPSHKVRWW